MKYRHYKAPAMHYLEAIAACSRLTSDGWLIVGAHAIGGELELVAIRYDETRIAKTLVDNHIIGAPYEPLEPAVEALLVPFDPQAKPKT